MGAGALEIGQRGRSGGTGCRARGWLSVIWLTKYLPALDRIIGKDGFLSGLSNVVGTQNNVLGVPYTVRVFNSEETAYKWIAEDEL